MDATKEQLAELKKAEMEILCAFIDVCKKLNLTYYVVGGTLIGAIRHQGFIPWDDDIDVAMPREDYEIFMEKAKSILPEYLFAQNIYTDEAYVQCFGKLRNSNTTFIESSAGRLKINHGTYIDIFPIDYFPENPKDQKRILRKRKFYDRRVAATFNIGHPQTVKRLLISTLCILRFPSLKAVLKNRDKMYKAVPKSSLLTIYGGADVEKKVAPVEWFGDGVPVMFEGIEVTAPIEYHRWLSQRYGDYMQLPPEEKRVAHHYADVIDLSKSYKHYVQY